MIYLYNFTSIRHHTGLHLCTILLTAFLDWFQVSLPAEVRMVACGVDHTVALCKPFC